MKTLEEIKAETPLSITGTDNPIFEICVSDDMIEARETSIAVEVKGSEKMEMVSHGERYRLLGCKLVEKTDKEPNPASPFRLGMDKVIYIPTSVLKYISGDLGENIAKYETENHEK